MEIKVDRFINELATRTIKNYSFIKDNCKREDVHEVTQLINSMYCLLVVPEEIFGLKPTMNENGEPDTKLATDFASKEKRLKNKDPYQNILKIIEDLTKRNRLKYETDNVTSNFLKSSPVSCLLYYLRNSLCHEGIGFLPIATLGEKNREITDVIFSHEYYNTKFMLVISVEDLEKLMIEVGKFYSDIEKGKASAYKTKYMEFYTNIESDMRSFIGEYR